jgi:ATP-dependent 26S proteasome regulatory subunit
MADKERRKPGENALPIGEGSEQEQVTRLEERIQAMNAEKQLKEAQRLKLDQELHSLRFELDQMRQPPVLYSRVAAILPDGRVVVEGDGGYRKYIVNVSSKVLFSELKPGIFVGLNQRTLSPVEIVPDDTHDSQVLSKPAKDDDAADR